MKSVLISIQPKWCELIASGKKTVEVRKTRPKLETPFKCYIYQCKIGKVGTGLFTRDGEIMGTSIKNGKVIGEFVCDEIQEVYQCNSGWIKENACISRDDFFDYLGIPRGTHLGYNKKAYAWHISDLVIYDKPRALSGYYHYCGDNPKCDGCEAHYYSNTECGLEDYCCSVMDGCKPLKRPPQSWCYVESEG